MFVGTLSDTTLAEKLHPRMQQFFEFVRQHNFDNEPLGRIDIDGNLVFVNNVDTAGASEAAQPLEMHRLYIDVHVLLRGTERMGYLPTECVTAYSQEYREDGDCALSTQTPQFYVDMKPGDFCIVYPEDAHAPAISTGRIRKLIGKIKI